MTRKNNRRPRNPAKPVRRSGARQVIAPQNRQPSNASVAISKPSTNAARAIPARQVATDYLGNNAFSKLADGDVIFSVRVTPENFPTLSRFATSFQRIRYNKVMFQLSSQMPTTTPGGYIMGFRPDADDRLPTTALSRKQFLVGTPSSVKNSAWQSYNLVVPSKELTSKLYYTSSGVDPREFCPGTLFVIVDGAIDQPGSFSLSATYDVTCSVPSLDYFDEVVPSDLSTAVKFYGYDGDNQWRSGDTSGSAFLTWGDVFPKTPRPAYNVVLEAVQYGIKRSSDASQDIEWTQRLGYWAKDDTFYSVGLTATKKVNAAPLKSPTGNTQILPVGMPVRPTGDAW